MIIIMEGLHEKTFEVMLEKFSIYCLQHLSLLTFAYPILKDSYLRYKVYMVQYASIPLQTIPG